MSDDPHLDEVTEAVRSDARRFGPQILAGLEQAARGAPLEQWDADTLVSRLKIFSAHCRDSAIRLVGIDPPPPSADRAWWRAAADEADQLVSRISHHVELAKLAIFTADPTGIRYMLLSLIVLAFIEKERTRRVEATSVGRAARRLLVELEPEPAEPLRDLVAALRSPARSRRAAEEGAYNDPVLAFLEFYEKGGQVARRLPVGGYRALALSPMSKVRPAVNVPAWENWAGPLLEEDIQDAREILLPLLDPGLDERAQWAVREALRKAEREGAAQQRGGPGASWRCGCGVSHLWTKRACETCSATRPPAPIYISLDEARVGDATAANPEAHATTMAFLDGLRTRWGALPAYRAFRRHLLEGLSLPEAARAEGVPESTLRDWIRKQLRPLLGD